jgi:hypothetical protein
MKKCCRCKEEKSLTEFYRNKSAKDGLTYECKSCKKNMSLEWKKNNREKVNDEKKKYYQKHKKRISERNSKYRKSDEYKKSNVGRKKSNISSLRIKSLEYKGHICEDCGNHFVYPKDMGLYNFHHVNPNNKKYSISKMCNQELSWKRIMEELDKCVLLCKPCHINRHTDFNRGLRPTL